MKKLCLNVKAFFKSGMDGIVTFCKGNKKDIIILMGRFVLFICKTIIEMFLDSRF